jgi:hypothetical protein
VGLAAPKDTQPGSIPRFLANLEQLLTEMVEIAAAEDYILLADLMEYELLPLVQQWQKILADLACR